MRTAVSQVWLSFLEEREIIQSHLGPLAVITTVFIPDTRINWAL